MLKKREKKESKQPSSRQEAGKQKASSKQQTCGNTEQILGKHISWNLFGEEGSLCYLTLIWALAGISYIFWGVLGPLPASRLEQLFLPSPCKHCKAFRILQEQQPCQFDMGMGEVGNLKSAITIIYITCFTPLNIPFNPHAKGKCVEHVGRNPSRGAYCDFMLSWKNRTTKEWPPGPPEMT